MSTGTPEKPIRIKSKDDVGGLLTDLKLALNRAVIDDSEPCNGWFYRGKVNQYYDGGFREDRRLVRLKRKSCSGCSGCGWIDEFITEDYCSDTTIDLSFVEHGGLYRLTFEGGGAYHTEAGMEYDAPDIVFNKIVEK